MRKTYLYKARINKQTEDNCRKWLDLCRILYNQSLEQRIKVYKEKKESISAFEQMSQLPKLRKSSVEFKAVGSQVFQDVIQRLDKAYKSFFQRVKQGNGKVGFSRFKSRNRYDPFTFKQSRQRSLCRKKKGSNRRKKARLLVAKIHEKIANQRKDFLHKVVNHYIKEFQNIYIEDLNIKGMVKNRHLSKSISDGSWGMFFRLLTEKAESVARHVVKVLPHNTSQICSICGEKVQKSLSVRIHDCPFCNIALDLSLIHISEPTRPY